MIPGKTRVDDPRGLRVRRIAIGLEEDEVAVSECFQIPRRRMLRGHAVCCDRYLTVRHTFKQKVVLRRLVRDTPILARHAVQVAHAPDRILECRGGQMLNDRP